MGYRLNVASTYKVQYANLAFFNGCAEQVNLKLHDLYTEYCHDDGDYFWYNTEELNFADELEISRKSLKHIISRLGELDQEEVCVSNYDNEPFYTVGEFREILKYMLDNSDKDNDFVRLVWF